MRLPGERRVLSHPSFPPGDGPASNLQVRGQQALDAVAARLVILFLAFALAGTALIGYRHPGWTISAGLATAGCLVLLAGILTKRRPPLWLAAAVASGVLASGLLASGSGFLDQSQLHQAAAWVAAGVVGGVCASRGLVWGIAAFIGIVAVNLFIERSLGGPAPLYTFLGTFAYYLGTGAVHVMARRGFATTERALSAAEAAEAAQQVARQRWDASRRADRQLHDTVLATLTVLAHRGAGIAVADVRSACARDIEILQSGGAVLAPDVGDAALASAPQSARTGTAIAVVRAAVDQAQAAGLAVRVHEGDTNWGQVDVEPHIAIALREALGEAVANVRRHAAVGVIDFLASTSTGVLIVVVVDEGTGFDRTQVPADRLGLRSSIHERLSEVGGSATIWSRPGHGTSVMLRVPLANPDRMIGTSAAAL